MSTKTLQTVRFLTEHKRLKLIRQPQGDLILPSGKVTKDPSRPSVTYQFIDGELTAREGQDLLADLVNSDTGEVEEQDAISWLRSHSDYGVRFHEVEPVAPPASDVLTKVALAAAAGDIDGLVALGDAEAESWHREDVLDVIRASIDNIQAAPAEAG